MTPRWTPEQLRNEAEFVIGTDASAMLRQAADDADAVARLTAENAQVKTCLAMAEQVGPSVEALATQAEYFFQAETRLKAERDEARAEVSRLTAENERLHIAVCRAAWERDEARAEVARLTAENERLRADAEKWQRQSARNHRRAQTAEAEVIGAILRSRNGSPLGRQRANVAVNALVDLLEQANQRTDEARAIAQREKAYGDVAYKMGWVSPAEQRSRERDAATIAGWANPSKSVVE